MLGEHTIKIKILSKVGCEIMTLHPSCTMRQLKQKLADKARINVNSAVISKGYFKPRETVDFSKGDAKILECNIISGDILHVAEKPPGEIHREDVPRTEVVNTESFTENPGMLMKKVVPGDNSCLFTSIGFVINGEYINFLIFNHKEKLSLISTQAAYLTTFLFSFKIITYLLIMQCTIFRP